MQVQNENTVKWQELFLPAYIFINNYLSETSIRTRGGFALVITTV